MYASLVGVGVSALWDLFKSQTQSAGATATPASPVESSASAQPAATSNPSAVGQLSTDLNKLLLDLQSDSAAAGGADPVKTVGTDLQSLHGDLSKSVGHHHHRHGAAAPQGAEGTDSAQSAANPFQSLASSLLAYTKGQALGATQAASTGLIA